MKSFPEQDLHCRPVQKLLDDDVLLSKVFDLGAEFRQHNANCMHLLICNPNYVSVKPNHNQLRLAVNNKSLGNRWDCMFSATVCGGSPSIPSYIPIKIPISYSCVISLLAEFLVMQKGWHVPIFKG